MFVYSSAFKKRFKKLPRKTQAKAMARLGLLVQDEYSPLLDNHPLRGEYAAYQSINVTGDIRIVYRKLKPQLYFLVAIGSHSQLYE